MNIKLVYRDAAGAVVNIGEWDRGVIDIMEPIYEERPALPNGERYRSPPLVIGHKKIGETITNPIPEGVTCQMEEVRERSDGGFAAASDYASLRRAAYPALVDQLDAIWKGGAAEAAMREQVLAVKASYPK